ncbi:hypothetical protein BC567DRAFT_236241 [Phyllosticta citribraziliensis]
MEMLSTAFAVTRGHIPTPPQPHLAQERSKHDTTHRHPRALPRHCVPPSPAAPSLLKQPPRTPSIDASYPPQTRELTLEILDCGGDTVGILDCGGGGAVENSRWKPDLEVLTAGGVCLFCFGLW